MLLTLSRSGVGQFKTALLQRLERDCEPTFALRHERSDAEDKQNYYQNFYNDYVKALDGAEHLDRAQMAKACQTAAVLFEVLKTVNRVYKAEEPQPEVIAASLDVVTRECIPSRS